MRVAAWNVEGRLSRFAEPGQRGSPEHILSGIKALKSDVIVLPEAYDAARPMEPEIRRELEAEYQLLEVAYDDRGNREHSATEDPHIMIMSRLAIVNSEVLPFVGGIRTMLFADVISPDTGETVRIFGIHLDDRNEENRLSQVKDLAPLFTAAAPYSVIAMGDFNAMPRGGRVAGVLRSGVAAQLSSLARPLPNVHDKIERLREMATGSTIEYLESNTNLVDSDPRHRPTITPKMRDQEWMPSVPVAQIDHIYLSRDQEASNFTVAGDGGSDHRAISVTARQNHISLL